MIVPPHLPKETRKEYALRAIRENIIKWELKPGSLVSEQKLADELGLSRIPVREALTELSKSRIVEIYPQRGSRIAPIDYDLIQEAEFIRRVMDCAIVEMSCEIATQENFDWLEEHLNLQTYYWKNSSPERLSELDFEYHKYYYEICNKMQCHAMVQNMNIHFDRVRHISILIQKDLKLVDDHRKIFEAVRARDPVLAHQLVCKHLTRYQVEKEAIEEAFLQYFK